MDHQSQVQNVNKKKKSMLKMIINTKIIFHYINYLKDKNYI